ncbi:VOC family protein [Corynebacterium mendelii]|uniref:VOC family protein n=1 Tax=Corynebacterium mendelii TaxID=2765362 RepID=A0A939IU08_9CORY|nr:VOC family protein [Corynebacterium mendelii]MBN9644419.1 VOC family protein [Corynebacterium mendelii]
MPAFNAVATMPYWLDLMSTDTRKSTYFYSTVLGWDIAETDSGWRMAKAQGLPVAGMLEKPDDFFTDTWVTYFMADDLEALTDKAAELGSRVLAGPQEIALGTMAVLVDPAGALFGLIQPHSGDAFIAGGEPGTTVWHENAVVTAFDETIAFYAELFDWAIEVTVDEHNRKYGVATEEGMPFAGFWDAAGVFGTHVPSFWQSYLGVEDLGTAHEAVVRAGGEVVSGPQNSPFGPMMVVADSTGATVTFCEVAPYVEQGHEGDELAGMDLSAYGIDTTPLPENNRQ